MRQAPAWAHLHPCPAHHLRCSAPVKPTCACLCACRERIAFIEQLEHEGWELEEAVDEYACLHNQRPSADSEGRMARAWDLVERWEEGAPAPRLPGAGYGAE